MSVLHRKEQLGIPRDRQGPGDLCADSAQSIRPEQTSIYQRRIGEIPGVWMGGIDPAKGIEKLPGFDLQTERQTRRLQKCLFELDLGFVVVVELEDNVGEAFEIGIDRAVERDFGVARIEAALLRIVIADLDVD